MEGGQTSHRTKNEIVELIAKQKRIEDIILNIKGEISSNEQDLAQDLYLSLLDKEEEKIIQLYEKGELRWFVTRMVVNNLKSVNSRFYYNYLKNIYTNNKHHNKRLKKKHIILNFQEEIKIGTDQMNSK